MPADFFLDSNVILYALGNQPDKKARAVELITQTGVISVQVLNEVANVLRRKLGFDHAAVREVLATLGDSQDVRPLKRETVFLALLLAERHAFSHYDSLIVASALEAGCATLYSEDMQAGLLVEGRLKIVNPFAA